MKALVYNGPNDISVADWPDVRPKDGEVRLKVRACGICGSDVHGYLGITGRRIAPMVMGHEFSGEITGLGSGVTGFAAGDRVASYPVDFCGDCVMCRAGDVHLCLHKRAFGVLDVDGAFAEYICVPAKACFPLADSVSWTVGSLMEPLAVAYRGVRHAQGLAGKDVLVIGAGTIGLLALACVAMEKPRRIIVSDLSDSRLLIAKKMGADIIVNPSSADFHKTVMDATDGIGVDVAIEAVGLSSTVQQAMSALRFGGQAIWIGNSKRMIEINMQEVVTRELQIAGSFLYGYDEFGKVVGLLGAGKLDVTPLISKEISLDQAPDYFYKLAHDPGDLIKVVVTSDG